MLHNLFVYGTLLQHDNQFADYLNNHSRFITAGKVQGVLYNTGDYPALIISEAADNTWVYGQIFHVDEDALSLIDDYEGYYPDEEGPDLFLRIKTSIDTNGGPVDAWVYVYNEPVEGLPVIPSGDYLEYLSQKKSPGI